MNKLTQRERIFEFLKQNPLKQFKPREVALGIVEKFPEYYKEKRKNPRFKTESDFINQIVAEIAKNCSDSLVGKCRTFPSDGCQIPGES